jgi:hypothetical protein
MAGLIPITPKEKELMARFDDFFRAVGQVFGRLAEAGDVDGFDFAIKGITAVAGAAKEAMARKHPYLKN